METKSVETKSDNLISIQTPYGEMIVKLYDETPLHKANFLKLVAEGFYDSTLFHRVIKDFMIQGGDPDSKHAVPGQHLGSGGLDYTVPAEFRAEKMHKKGALSAARMGDQMNPQKASSSCQFYIVQGQVFTPEKLEILSQQGYTITPEQKAIYTTVGGTPFLDNQYTVFGEVIKGLDIIDKIVSVATDAYDRPTEDIQMIVKIVQ